jgi:trk system potassium uptake protein TrkA
MDVFIALTDDDEVNILSSMLAKKLGARKVMSIINRPAYVDLVENGIIDIAISPHSVTIGALLKHIRRADIVAVHSLRRGMAEAIEVVAHGDPRTSKVIGRQLNELNLPSGSSIGAIVRDKQVLIAHHDLIIETDDHVILFMIDKTQIEEVERLFEVKLGFF